MCWFPEIPKQFVFTMLIGFITMTASAQDVDLRGYLKELGSVSFSDDLGTFHYDNIIHHRMESKTSFDNGLEFRLDIRNRILSGYSVQNTPGYTAFLDEDPGYVDMNWIVFETDHSLLHSTIDRLQMSYFNGSWEFNLGRQRINWGKTYVWNPNDLFNAYAYLDFDYEERPGTDALSASYSWSYASSVQIGYRFGDSFDESVVAGMLRENIGDYDVQFIAGSYFQQLVLGAGFSGYLKNAGLNGELSYFNPRENFFDQNGHLTVTIGSDYMFTNSLYLSGELLYNGGFDKAVNPLAQLTTPPTADNLFISKTGIYVNGSIPVSPLTNVSLGSLTSFTESIFIIIPQVSYSLMEDIDVLLLAQVFRGSVLDGVTNTPNLLFFRVKWSY